MLEELSKCFTNITYQHGWRAGQEIISTTERAQMVAQRLLLLDIDATDDLAAITESLKKLSIQPGDDTYSYREKIKQAEPTIKQQAISLASIKKNLFSFMRCYAIYIDHNILGNDNAPLWNKYCKIIEILGGEKLLSLNAAGSDIQTVDTSAHRLTNYQTIIKTNEEKLVAKLLQQVSQQPYTVTIFEWFRAEHKKLLRSFDVGGHITALITGPNNQQYYIGFSTDGTVINIKDSLYNKLASHLHIPKDKYTQGEHETFKEMIANTFVNGHPDNEQHFNDYYVHYNSYTLNFSQYPDAFDNMVNFAEDFTAKSAPDYHFYKYNCSNPVKDMLLSGKLEQYGFNTNPLNGDNSKPINIRYFAEQFILKQQYNSGMANNNLIAMEKLQLQQNIQSYLQESLANLHAFEANYELLAIYTEVKNLLYQRLKLLDNDEISTAAFKNEISSKIASYHEQLQQKLNDTHDNDLRNQYLDLITILSNLSAIIACDNSNIVSQFYYQIEIDSLVDIKSIYDKISLDAELHPIPKFEEVISNTLKLNIPTDSIKQLISNGHTIEEVKHASYDIFMLKCDSSHPLYQLCDLLNQLKSKSINPYPSTDNLQNLYNYKQHTIQLRKNLKTNIHKQKNPLLKIFLEKHLDKLNTIISNINKALYFNDFTTHQIDSLEKEISLSKKKPSMIKNIDNFLTNVKESFDPSEKLKPLLGENTETLISSKKPIVITKPHWLNIFDIKERVGKNYLQAKSQIWQLLNSKQPFKKNFQDIAHIANQHKPSWFANKAIESKFDQLRIKAQIFLTIDSFIHNRINEVQYSYLIEKLSKQLAIRGNNQLLEDITKFNKDFKSYESNYHQSIINDSSLSSTYNHINYSLLKEKHLKLNTEGYIKPIKAKSMEANMHLHYNQLFKPCYETDPIDIADASNNNDDNNFSLN